MPNETELARVWLSRFLGGSDVSHFSDDEVVAFVEKAHPGGVADLADVPQVTTYSSDSVPFWAKDRDPSASRELPDTPIRQRARAMSMFRYRMPAHADWVDAKFSPTEVIIHLIVREVDVRSRRVKVVREGQRLVRWSRPAEGMMWGRADELTVWSDDPSYDVHLFGSIMTPEVHADKTEQWETCYRPGTERTPMQGPASRAGVSRKEYWGDEYTDNKVHISNGKKGTK